MRVTLPNKLKSATVFMKNWVTFALDPFFYAKKINRLVKHSRCAACATSFFKDTHI